MYQFKTLNYFYKLRNATNTHGVSVHMVVNPGIADYYQDCLADLLKQN